ncbi:MAG TPA: FAD-binding protein [Dehalococcoidia bacterium]|nr:FAD-binding protein [Dehalococcoidia bacterium]
MAGSNQDWDIEADVVGVGSGGGAMLACVVAEEAGLSSLLLERAEVLGGGEIYSGAQMWIPCNHYARELGIEDSVDDAMQSIRATSLDRHDEEIARAYFDAAPEMLRFLEDRAEAKTMLIARPDYVTDVPGAKVDGRFLEPRPFKGEEELGDFARKIRVSPYLPKHLPKGTWGGSGMALIGPLAKALRKRDIPIVFDTRVRELITEDGAVVGLRAEQGGRQVRIKANYGVILNTGGFTWDLEQLKRTTHGPIPQGFTPPVIEGDGIRMATALGAATAMMDAHMYLPCLEVPGETHLEGEPLHRMVMGPTQPGGIFVNRYGKRYCNEAEWTDILRGSLAYDFVSDGSRRDYLNVPPIFIFDQEYRAKYITATLPQVGKSGMFPDWVKAGDTIAELAEALEIEPAVLEETVERFNRFALEGKDPDFHRGERQADRWFGDNTKDTPNASLGPLETPPYFAIVLTMGSCGNTGGLVTNTQSQVINSFGDTIPGLYACGLDQAALNMGYGVHWGPVSNALTFGYVAGKDCADRAGKPLAFSAG